MFKDLKAVDRSSPSDNDARVTFIVDQLLVEAANEAVANGLPVTFPPPPVESAIFSYLLSTRLPYSTSMAHSLPNTITFSTLPMPKPTLFSSLRCNHPRI
jgi:hypothetical protein